MFKLTIWNLTGSYITAVIPSPAPRSSLHRLRKWNRKHRSSECLLEPQLDFSTTIPTAFPKAIVLKSGSLDGECGLEFRIRVSMPWAAGCWKAVCVPKDCPWRIYIIKVTSTHRQLMILERRNLASFMAELPDRLPLSSLSLPGTHDTMALYGWPISQCQTMPLLNQLLGGIRVIDIRLAVIPPAFAFTNRPKTTVSPELIAYHGTWPQRTKFYAILNDVYEFLASPIGQSETIVMSIKQEDDELTPAGVFSEMVRNAIVFGPGGGWAGTSTVGSSVNSGMWFLENRIPTLGEVRGKVVLFSRFGGDGSAWPEGLEGIGIHPKWWPDSRKEGFEWNLKGTRVRTQDWYSIPSFFSIPEKVKLGTMNLFTPKGTGQAVMPITYFSAVNIPLALPPIIAKGFGWPDWGLGVYGVNTLLGKWLLEQMASTAMEAKAKRRRKRRGDLEKEKDLNADNIFFAEEPRIRGWSFLDYYSEPGDSQVVPLLVECNFLGRKPGEEGW